MGRKKRGAVKRRNEEEKEEEAQSRSCQGTRSGSMAPCQCHYVGARSGAVSAQTDVTHTRVRALVRRPTHA